MASIEVDGKQYFVMDNPTIRINKDLYSQQIIVNIRSGDHNINYSFNKSINEIVMPLEGMQIVIPK